mmetsp:Transcript_100984/g.225538  ORF Transcript_100984/g.225538 Transcript_100984/m.225538 type:complete len:294 (+) Transcript_100984:66-947(+)
MSVTATRLGQAELEQEEPLLPRGSRSSLQPRASGKRCLSCVEDLVAFTDDEVEAHQRLLDLAAVKLSAESTVQEEALRHFWEKMVGGEYQAKSKRWRELGFQGDDPRTDFRGGGFLALRCLCYLVDHHLEETKRWVEEARRGECEYLFSAACINVCGLLLVHLELNAQSIVAPVKSARPACNLALKRFVRRLPSCESEFQAFGELFAAAVERMHREWRAFCTRTPGANLMHFGEALESVSGALECALSTSSEPTAALRDAEGSGLCARLACWFARLRSALLCGLLAMFGSCCV